ncbi:MAG TPA: hypothetical protein VMS64_38065 [Candidatus Methylomirabilis sp.]|nr:hypothetical protein [Candidatus Methylomirabilis sp.]
MRLEPRVRASLYAVTALMFVTGGIWWILDWRDALAVGSAWRQVGSYLLMAHGGAAMLALLLLGAMIPLHLRPAWPSGNSRVTGILMIAVNAALIVTAFGLYYIGHDALRRWTGTIHASIGFGMPALLAVHVWRGRRRRVERSEPWRSHHEGLAHVRPTSRRAAVRRAVVRSGGRGRH